MERERDRQRDRETERQRDRETERQREESAGGIYIITNISFLNYKKYDYDKSLVAVFWISLHDILLFGRHCGKPFYIQGKQILRH